MDDELRQGSVEGSILEREVLGGRTAHIDVRLALLRCDDEALGRIDRRDRRRAEALDQLGRQGTRTAADIEHSLALGDGDGGEVGEARREHA